jgi:PAS domain S-box-containing protein
MTRTARDLQALRRSDELYRTLVEGTHALLFSIDVRGRLIFANEGACWALGLPLEAILGRRVLEFIHEEDRRLVLRAVERRGKGTSVEFRLAGSGERWISAVLNASGDGWVGAGLDVTERKHLEDRLRQAEKMSAMGQYSAGIAHDLNSPLGAITGFCGAALELGPTGALKETLHGISRAAERCHALVQGLMRFSRRDGEAPRYFALTDAVADALALVESAARQNGVRVVRDLPDEELALHGFPSDVEQIVINIAANAIDAMPKGGTLTVTARGARDGRAELELRDTGTGIPPEAQAKLFEPFYTTKPAGKGTGLGLSIAHEILERIGGEIRCESRPGAGTVFTVVLPVVAQAAAA